MSLLMICPKCEGRWVALSLGGTVGDERVSYHYHREALRCPRCGEEGECNGDAVLEYQQHPDVVATTRLRGIRA